MKPAIPHDHNDLTPSWLSAVLGYQVISCDIGFLEGGVLSDAYKARSISYQNAPADAPTALVIKIANKIRDLRDFGMMANAYNKELNFFRDLSADVPITVPRLYGCDTDGSDGAEYFYIVMEDLSTHSRVFDQVNDPPDAAFARKTAMEIAKLHAKYWNDAVTRLPWVGSTDGRYLFSFDPLCRVAKDNWDMFQALYSKMYGHDFFSTDDFSAIEAMTNTLCGPRSIEILDRITAILSSRPKTLLHGDMRADNLFRTDPAAGKSVDDSALTFIDWQLLHAGPPGPDFAQAWFSSLERDVRQNDLAILAEYHQHLLELNPAVQGYTYDMLIEDYALGCCLWWMALISLGTGAFPSFETPEGARSKQLWGRALGRIRYALTELGCPALINRLAADRPA